MDKDQFEQAMYDELKGLETDEAEETQEGQYLNQQEMQEAYGYPEPEEKQNQHAFLANSLKEKNPEKVTFMTESELGTPLFNLRFLLDIEDICKYYLDDIVVELKLKDSTISNKISAYFREKIVNISDSGMSNKGFVQNLNVTKKMESTRERIKNLGEVKGGKR